MKISLYIHIPFCVRKCLYCDFNSGPYDNKVRSSYVEALTKELVGRACELSEYEVISIFFGGGTPSILEVEAFSRIMDTIHKNYNLSDDCEITMEVNPGTVGKTEKKLSGFKEAGINRISIGLQSANDDELKHLGRIHTRADFEQTYKLAHEAGINNVNVDIMTAIPGQTMDSYIETLRYVTALNPPPQHISAYSLIIEEGTPYYDIYGDKESESEESKMYGLHNAKTLTVSDCCEFQKEGQSESEHHDYEYMRLKKESVSDKLQKITLPDEDTEREMYDATRKLLHENGYERYEISNYSKPGFESRHNSVYWERGNYYGFGVGASSLIENVRFKNNDNIFEYIADPLDENKAIDKEILTKKEQMEEFMFLGLRMTKGISIKVFENYFGIEFPTEYIDVIEKYMKMGYMEAVPASESKKVVNINSNESSDCNEEENAGSSKLLHPEKEYESDLAKFEKYIVFRQKYDRIMLTNKGIDISNYILSEFIF
ncbi:MAG: radical SAM family heme chaperone HemW [Lachnospiraceae bacterium]|nr:radical SAM family heme chaperone HemW [Lachnospiraceae bacterium]